MTATGKCAMTPINACGTCNADSGVCTNPDTCGNGSCAAGATWNCNDSNPCTSDGCNVATGCTYANVADNTICNTTGICKTGLCKPGVCGDGVKMAALGEQCDDGNTVSGDGCTSDCKVEDAACADGTRDGYLDAVTYPNIAMCDGPWQGWVGATGAGTAAAQGRSCRPSIQA